MKTYSLISTLIPKGLNQLIALVLCFISISLFSKTEKYRLVWTTDPATEITIGWNQLTGDAPVLYYDDTNEFGTGCFLAIEKMKNPKLGTARE